MEPGKKIERERWPAAGATERNRYWKTAGDKTIATRKAAGALACAEEGEGGGDGAKLVPTSARICLKRR